MHLFCKKKKEEEKKQICNNTNEMRRRRNREREIISLPLNQFAYMYYKTIYLLHK